MTTSREPPNDTALAGLKRAHVTLGVCRDEHEASRGERVARETRIVDPKLESPRRVHPLESSRLASPRVQASRTRLDSLEARRVGSRTRLARADLSANLTHRLLR